MESYTFLVDNRLNYPYNLISDYGLYASEQVGDISVFVYQYTTLADLDKVKTAFNEFFPTNYKFELKFYNDSRYVEATFYALTIQHVFSSQYDEQIRWLNEYVWPVAEPILQKEYESGRLKLPLFFFFGESLSSSVTKIERYELAWLALQQYALADFYGRWKEYAFYKDDIYMLKYGAYEKAVSTDVVNCFDGMRSVSNIRGLERSNSNLTNWIWCDSEFSRTRIIGLNYSNIKLTSPLNMLLIKKDFWTKFVLAQFLDEDVREKYDAPITSMTFLVSKFVNKLLESERKELADLESKAQDSRLLIENYIHEITLRKLKLVKQDNEIVLKKKNSTSETKLRTSLATQMATLMKHPYVTDIEVGEEFVIHTTPIKVDGNVSIGGYAITLTMGQKPTIRVVNMENPMEGFDHPHISRGNPCWGNYTDVYVHLSNADLISTMEIMFRFLESWNPVDSWGKNLIWWDAKYAFDNLKDAGLMHTVERSWRGYYRDTYGADMNGTSCEHCGEEEAYCDCYCSRCGERRDEYCTCNRCEECGNLWEDGYRECGCDRCGHCNSHYDDCECSFCDYCGGNRDAGECYCDYCSDCYENITAEECTCERCNECGLVLEDCDCERCDICGALSVSEDCTCEEDNRIGVREGQIQMETIV